MPNHVHLVVAPDHEDSLSRFFRFVHRHDTRQINFREKWTGHLWQERFYSYVMDEAYLLSAVRYVELNPVRARLCRLPEEWNWSSAWAHLAGKDDGVVVVKPMLERISDWSDYLSEKESKESMDILRQHARTGRPADSDAFIDDLEVLTGKTFKKGKPEPKQQIK
ncbi:transposase [Gammaproteobacteria bacterium AH-315-C21]|nr:transposase [Gammaproteobacteria bacterium AH-315-C21]